MTLTRTWIDSNLSRKERKRLVDWLLERAQNPTGDLIRTGLEELFPDLAPEDLPSVASCLTWRNKVWAFELHCRELREETEAARHIAGAGSGPDLDEANRVLLQTMIFQQLRALKEGRIEDLDADTLDKLARNVSVLARQGQHERELSARLRDLERREAEAKAVTTDEQLTGEEKHSRIKQIFGI